MTRFRTFRNLTAFVLLIGAVLVVAALSRPQASTSAAQPTLSPPSATPAPQHPGVAWPEGFPDDYVHYARVERKDGTIRDLYVDRATLERARAHRTLTFRSGTVLVISGYQALQDEDGDTLRDEAGRMIQGDPFPALHVIEKRGDWQRDDFVSAARSGQWNFGSFDPETQQPFPEDFNTCFNCHNTAARSDFIYSRFDLTRYLASGEVQIIECDQTGRTPCEG